MEGVIEGSASSTFLQRSLSSHEHETHLVPGAARQAPRLQQRRLGAVHASLGAATADPKQAIRITSDRRRCHRNILACVRCWEATVHKVSFEEAGSTSRCVAHAPRYIDADC